MAMNFEDKVRCNKCMKEFFENEIIYNEEENEEYCPYCGESGWLMDLEDNHYMENLIKEVEELNDNTPNGIVHDADTILVDLIEKCDYEFSGFAQDIFNIWKDSTDKKAVEQMFYEFTDMEFVDYLKKCKLEISR